MGNIKIKWGQFPLQDGGFAHYARAGCFEFDELRVRPGFVISFNDRTVRVIERPSIEAAKIAAEEWLEITINDILKDLRADKEAQKRENEE